MEKHVFDMLFFMAETADDCHRFEKSFSVKRVLYCKVNNIVISIQIDSDWKRFRNIYFCIYYSNAIYQPKNKLSVMFHWKSAVVC